MRWELIDRNIEGFGVAEEESGLMELFFFLQEDFFAFFSVFSFLECFRAAFVLFAFAVGVAAAFLLLGGFEADVPDAFELFEDGGASSAGSLVGGFVVVVEEFLLEVEDLVERVFEEEELD
jgi:hypothetical protein